MGYTHYWTYNPNAIKDTEELRKKFRKVADIVKKANIKRIKNPLIHTGQAGGYYDHICCSIRGGLGKGTAMINESQIWFNGDEKIDMDHETFSIQWYPKEGKVNDFCKTNRKPYDLLVCVTLLAMNEVFKGTGAFTFSSDGGNEEWQTAKNVFTSITGSFVGEIFPEKEMEVA